MQNNEVLVVDDDRDLRTALVMALEAEGHTVIEAEHGRDALARMTETAPHLIILDLTMPVMDGRAFLDHKAKTEHAAIPVVVFSSSPPDQIEAMPSVEHVVHKLSGVDALLAAIRQVAAKLTHVPSDEEVAFRRLERQLLGLGLLEPILEEGCSTCGQRAPLSRARGPGLCLRCLGRSRGFEFSDSP